MWMRGCHEACCFASLLCCWEVERHIRAAGACGRPDGDRWLSLNQQMADAKRFTAKVLTSAGHKTESLQGEGF